MSEEKNLDPQEDLAQLDSAPQENSVILSEDARSESQPKDPEGADPDDTADAFSTPAPHTPFALEHPPTAPPPPAPKRERDKSRDEASQSPFSITVGQVYDGPLDLLLDLIRKQNIDIYDIPIARITAQFLEYTHHLKDADVDAAGEFIYVASLLIHIKSRMLLPRDPLTPESESEDPRRELVERLLEHERFKAAAQMLLQKQMLEEATWTQSGLKNFLHDEGVDSTESDREIDADTVDLVRVFQDILDRLRNRPVHNIDEETVTVAQMIDFVKRRLLMEDRPVSLRRMLQNTKSERAVICTFLAMLELVRLQAIVLRQGDHFGDILVKKTDRFDQVFAEQAQVRDDWS
ncbi:MAG: segregation/condensation protein A [Acidobacteriaceae bacterium]|jgi:segregation and condensation protein A